MKTDKLSTILKVLISILMIAVLSVSALSQEETSQVKNKTSEELSILMFGDTNIQHRQNPADAFKHLMPTLRTADVRFANCEMLFVEPSTDPLSPDIPHKKTWQHSKPEMVQGLVAAGFDVVGFASNVVYPPSAMMKSLPVLDRAGILHTGSGKNVKEAHRPVIIERKGVKIGFLQWTSVFWHIGHAATDSTPGVATIKIHTSYEPHYRVLEMPGGPPRVITIPNPMELERMRNNIESLRKEVDIVVASFQWGISNSTEIADYQRTLARAAVDAGADIVIGHGPHVLQAIETYHGRPIFFSLGNFVFDWEKQRQTKDGLMVRALVKNKRLARVTFTPLSRNVDNDPVLLNPNEEEGAEKLKQLIALGGDSGAKFQIEGKEIVVGLK
jgi:hypothetical protein